MENPQVSPQMLESKAAVWFDETWAVTSRRLSRTVRIDADHLLAHGQTVRQLMPRLLDIVAKDLHHDVQALRPALQTVVSEQGLCRTAQGIIPPQERAQIINCCLDTLLIVLTRVRRQAIEHGTWSKDPSTVPMCG
ncbi:hypothetical protein [Mucisphaera sp.]|uniref:hypothetical protein n=1 Tax=Mucisphaera sp. TaxID=2913024 RepID=UPI003D09F204